MVQKLKDKKIVIIDEMECCAKCKAEVPAAFGFVNENGEWFDKRECLRCKELIELTPRDSLKDTTGAKLYGSEYKKIIRK